MTPNAIIRTQIVTLLGHSGDYQFPENALYQQVSAGFGPAATLGANEFELALEWLQERGYVDFGVDTLSAEKRWYLTPAGKRLVKR
jgi:hypothetical protein